MAQKIIQMPMWAWYALMIVIGLEFAFLTYGVFTGKDERQTINENVGQLLSNVSQIDSQQTVLLQEIKDGQNRSEEIRQEQLDNLIPALERLFIQTNTIENNTNETKTLTTFLTENFGNESGYLEKENFQYGQANQTFKWLNQSLQNQEEIKRLLNSSNP